MKSANFLQENPNIFWDFNLNEINPEKDSFAIIKRIILKGGKKERVWMFENYSAQKIEETLNSSREIPEHLKEIYFLALKNAGSKQ